jgi:DNA-binding response OmpR family regulator
MYLKKNELKKEEDKNLKNPFRILVVEDDPQISNLLALFIKKYGYELCGVAESGEDAIRLIETTSPDVVFIDYLLKGSMNGIDLAQWINKEFPIPFIYITAYSDDQIIERVIHTCPSALILKPFKGEEIRVAVEIIINRLSGKKQ